MSAPDPEVCVSSCLRVMERLRASRVSGAPGDEVITSWLQSSGRCVAMMLGSSSEMLLLD